MLKSSSLAPNFCEDARVHSLELNLLEAYQLCLQWHVNALIARLGCDNELDHVVGQLWLRYLETRESSLSYVQMTRMRRNPVPPLKRRRRRGRLSLAQNLVNNKKNKTDKTDKNDNTNENNDDDDADYVDDGLSIIRPTRDSKSVDNHACFFVSIFIRHHRVSLVVVRNTVYRTTILSRTFESTEARHDIDILLARLCNITI